MKKINILSLGVLSFLVGSFTVSAAPMPDVDNGKITLTDDINLTETFTVNADEEITLDLAGHTITGSADIDYYTIENNGKLTIIDSGTDGKIICGEESSSCIRNNKGTLNIDGVYVESPFATIKNEADSTLAVKNSEIVSTHVGNSLSGGFTGALQNWGSATVDNTTITAASDYAVFARSGADEGKSSDITISNSNLSGSYFVVTERTNSTTTTQTINISDSTLSGRASISNNGSIQSYSGDITLTTNHVSVNNTVIANSEAGTKITLDVDYNTTLAIPDGVTVVIPEDHTLTVPTNGVKVGNGTLDLQGKMVNGNVLVENTNGYYPTLRDAVQSIKLDTTGTEITLLNDTNETRNISISRKEITIDLNGHDINSTTGINLANSATIEITDSSDNEGLVNTTVTNSGKLTISGGKFNNVPTTNQGATTTLVGGTFPSDEIADLEVPEDKEIITNEDGTASIVYKAADYTKVDEAIKNAEAIDRSKYTEESLKALDDAIAAVDNTLRLDRQDEVDAMADAINNAIANLVEITEDPNTDIENPSTSDNVGVFMALGAISVMGLAAATVVLKKRHN